MRSPTEYVHSHGLWIRFYTLDGATKSELSCHGWFHGYNFGSIEAAEQRWRAAIAAGVDYIASDQYEQLGKLVSENANQKALVRDQANKQSLLHSHNLN